MPDHRVPFRTALAYWARLGFVSFGGPAGQIAMMHRDLVEQRRWIGEAQFLHALNFCMLLPGPEAQQLATYIGWLLHGFRGGLAAGVLFVAPSMVLLYLLSWAYCAWGASPAATGLLAGAKAVVVALVIEAILRIGKKALRVRSDYVVAALAFVAIAAAGVPYPLVIAAAALFGWLRTRQAGEADVVATEALVASTGARTWTVLGVGLVLWVVPYLGLLAWRGADGLAAQQYRFFTVAALVTFGGAYAVLGYVTQAAVATYGWISASQAVDGLALAETTPGPLIMVLQFVGFLAGWQHPEDLSPLAAATLGACVTTYVTFLPCFVFVFLGAPYIERLRGNRSLSGALAGVTAAVAGVVLNLGVAFGSAVFFPSAGGGVDLLAIAMAAAAYWALAYAHVNVVYVVAGGAAVGWLIYG